jgi:hypothetical protein
VIVAFEGARPLRYEEKADDEESFLSHVHLVAAESMELLLT